MENNYLIQNFTNGLFGQIRSIIINGEPWFVGADVASCLGYARTADAITDHVDNEDKYFFKVGDLPTLKIESNYGAYLINESGLYSLIFSSRLPVAKEFKHWVTSEVLPTMRKIGFDNAMNILQQENMRLQQENEYLVYQNNLIGSIRQSQICKENELNYFKYWLINTNKLSLEDKIEAYRYDPDPYGNLGINLNDCINDFESKYLGR